MKKRIAVVFIAAAMLRGYMPMEIYAQDIFNNLQQQENLQLLKGVMKTPQNSNQLKVEIKGVSLTVSPNGMMSRAMNGTTSTFDYNAQYGSNVKFLKLMNWNGSFAALVCDNASGEKRVIVSGLGFIWQEVQYDYFAESDIPYVYGTKFNINDADVYGDQLYIACDEGIVLVITPCSKCYKLKKLSDFDITSVSFQGEFMKLNEGKESALDIPINEIRQDNIDVDEALNMRMSGAIFIDVRDKSEFSEYNYYDSVNIPLSDIDKISQYDRDTVLIFYCKSGGRSQKALQEAQKMGFVNVYNLGSVDKLVSPTN